MQSCYILDALSDRELLRAACELAESHRRIEAELVAHIAEVERRGLYRDEGFSSMFGYVTGVLGLSESAAYRRIRAAPLLTSRVSDCITVIRKLSVARYYWP